MSISDQSLVLNLLKLPENAVCADCMQNKPKWASCNLGIFICLDCSGIHRSLGSHISFVRSCNLDSWSHEQAVKMKCIGNAKANEYWECNLPNGFTRPNPRSRSEMEAFIRNKYVNKRWVKRGTKGPHELPIDEFNCRSNEEIIKYAVEEENQQDFLFDDLLNEIDQQKTSELNPQNTVEHVKYESVSFIPKEQENSNSNKRGGFTSAITTSASRLASSAMEMASSATSSLQAFFRTIEKNEDSVKNDFQIKEQEKIENKDEAKGTESKITYIKETAKNIYDKVTCYFSHDSQQTEQIDKDEKIVKTREEMLKNELEQFQKPDMSALEDFFQEQSNIQLDKEYEIQNNDEVSSKVNDNYKDEEEIHLLEMDSFEEYKKINNNTNEDNDSFDFLENENNNQNDKESITFDFLPKTDSDLVFKSRQNEQQKNDVSNLEKFFENHEEFSTQNYKVQTQLETRETQKITKPKENHDDFQFLQAEDDYFSLTPKTVKSENTKKENKQKDSHIHEKPQKDPVSETDQQQIYDSFGFLVLDESRRIPQ